MAASPLTMSDLRISTMVTTCHAGCGIRLRRLFENFGKWAIPFGYPGEGFLKMEFEKNVVGASTRDILTKRKVTEKTFFNQATLVIRKALKDGQPGWKEVNIKLFANGGIQMTGVPTAEFSEAAIQYVICEIVEKDTEVFTASPGLCKFRIQLINSDYSINRQIHQEKLHKILSNVYGLFSSHESTIYQGVNTKYYYNKKGNPLKPGICPCKTACSGQGNGDGEGECKRITISPFSSGKIIITGAREMDQINEAYEFFNQILKTHEREILFQPAATPA
jgi:TATA-box binding protein (TBP) (component of TFIID and TFIIIB)